MQTTMVRRTEVIHFPIFIMFFSYRFTTLYMWTALPHMKCMLTARIMFAVAYGPLHVDGGLLSLRVTQLKTITCSCNCP